MGAKIKDRLENQKAETFEEFQKWVEACEVEFEIGKGSGSKLIFRGAGGDHNLETSFERYLDKWASNWLIDLTPN